MTSIEIRNLVAAFFSLAFSVICLSYVLTNQRRKAKKPVYFAASMLFLISAAIYTLAFFVTYDDYNIPPWIFYAIRSGWATVVNLVFVGATVAANVLADWLKVRE